MAVDVRQTDDLAFRDDQVRGLDEDHEPLVIDVLAVEFGSRAQTQLAQEFECEFLDTASVLLPYELLIACENPLASAVVGPDYWLTNAASLF